MRNIPKGVKNPYVPVNTIKELNLLIAAIVLEVFVKMVFPLPSRDTLAHEGVDVVVDISQEDIQTTKETF